MHIIKEVIEKDGFYITATQGVSMKPIIRPKIDTVVLEKITGSIENMDVVCYISINDHLVLHRVLKKEADTYLICGDNCISFEHIHRDQFIGKLTKIYRGEKEINLDSLGYRIYVFLWCKPYYMRMTILRVWHLIKRIIRKVLPRRA